MLSKLRQPEERYQHLYENRIERLGKLIALKAPSCVIGTEARLVAECFEYTIADRFRRWQFRGCPEWLLWLTSAPYRQVCREEGSDDTA